MRENMPLPPHNDNKPEMPIEQEDLILEMDCQEFTVKNGISVAEKFAPENEIGKQASNQLETNILKNSEDVKEKIKSPKKIALIELPYLYGRKEVRMNQSLISVAARVNAIGHQATILDLNIDAYDSPNVQETLASSDIAGISLLGAPYFPQSVEFAERIQRDFPNITIAVGGQVVEYVSKDAFNRIFKNSEKVKQIIDNVDIAQMIGENPWEIPDTLDVSCQQIWEQMPIENQRKYMQKEMTLEVSAGCGFNCAYCAARKHQNERFKNPEIFEQDLKFQARRAKELGLTRLAFYASSLDFFQNPKEISIILSLLARVQEEDGVEIKVRCLSCMSSFLNSAEKIEKRIQSKDDPTLQHFQSFADLVNRAGVWSIGFGVDGSDENIWKLENKPHNKPKDIPKCITLCEQIGVRPEILMLIGNPAENRQMLWRTFKECLKYAFTYKGAVVRPYVTRMAIPGNKGWSPEFEEMIAKDPKKFYDLDYCAMIPPWMDTNNAHRRLTNALYMAIILFLRPFGKCIASPLLPQGAYAKLAKIVNRFMPADR